VNEVRQFFEQLVFRCSEPLNIKNTLKFYTKFIQNSSIC